MYMCLDRIMSSEVALNPVEMVVLSSHALGFMRDFEVVVIDRSVVNDGMVLIDLHGFMQSIFSP